MEFTLNDKTQSDIVLYTLLLNKINQLAPREKTRFRSENRKQLDFFDCFTDREMWILVTVVD